MIAHKTKSLPIPPMPRLKPKAKKKVTIADWLKLPEDVHVELINGKLVYEVMASTNHGRIMGILFSLLRDPYDRPPGSKGKPGGWWFSQDVDIKLGPHGLRPDVVGWRRDKHPKPPQPQKGVVIDMPDWIAEVLSPSTMARDWGDKHRIYHRYKVPHYWLVDPKAHTLTTLVWTEDDYKIGYLYEANDVVSAEPFDQARISMQELFDLEEAGAIAP